MALINHTGGKNPNRFGLGDFSMNLFDLKQAAVIIIGAPVEFSVEVLS